MLAPLLSLLLASAPAPLLGDHTVELWISTTVAPGHHPALYTNKDWNSGEVVTVTSNHDLGRTRKSGTLPGWCIYLQPNGAWGFNAGDGEHRVDYRPTAERQRINDGESHHVAFAYDQEARVVHLYHDGERVAILSTAELRDLPLTGKLSSGSSLLEEGDVIEGYETPRRCKTPEELAAAFGSRGVHVRKPSPIDPPPAELTVLAWNIWHGGRRDGNEAGLAKTVDVIRSSGADVVLMQETYGSGPEIADRLGFELYLRSSNLSVMTRYPIVDTHDVYRPFYLGGVTLDLGAGLHVRAHSLWIRYHDDFEQNLRAEGQTSEGLVEWSAPRARAIAEVLSSLDVASIEEPLLLGGDFNGPSHLDWTPATGERHAGFDAVAWPVSRALDEAGLIDAYRTMHPDPASHPGLTWSPRFPETWQERIDYVYSKGSSLVPIEAEVLREHREGWPSDHAAVLVTYRLVRDS